MKNSEILDLSHNKLTSILPEIGRLINLKILKLNDNFIRFIPMELGSLYMLEQFLIDNNPLLEPFVSFFKIKRWYSNYTFL